MRTKLGSGMCRMFLIAALAALSMFAGACDVSIGFPPCSKAPPKQKWCTCGSVADLQDPRCCVEAGTCTRETDKPACQMRTTGTPLITVPSGLIVRTSRGIGLPRACEPFVIEWSYLNAGNRTAEPLPGVRLEVTEETPTSVPPNERLMERLPPSLRTELANVSWSELAPCASQIKRVSFPQGITPHPLAGSGYTATIFVDSTAALPNAFTRFILFGSDCR